MHPADMQPFSTFQPRLKVARASLTRSANAAAEALPTEQKQTGRGGGAAQEGWLHLNIQKKGKRKRQLA